MSIGLRMPLQEALELAQEVSRRLTPVMARLKCVGSVRRRKETVGDIEFLAEPVMHEDLFGGTTPVIEPVRAAMHQMGTWVKGGERMMQVSDLLGHPGLKLDVYLVHAPSAWGSQLAIRTGPAELGHYCVMRMREVSRVRHDAGSAWCLDSGLPVPTDTEEQFFELAKVPCVPPREREELATRLWSALNVGTQREAITPTPTTSREDDAHP